MRINADFINCFSDPRSSASIRGLVFVSPDSRHYLDVKRRRAPMSHGDASQWLL